MCSIKQHIQKSIDRLGEKVRSSTGDERRVRRLQLELDWYSKGDI